MKKLVSIVVPVYNAEKFILKTINTVVNQTYTNWELILVDDLSTDNSVKIIEDYIDQTHDNRIILIKLKEKKLAAGSRNEGVNGSKGEYLCFLDADDFWDKNKLEKQVNLMETKKCEFSFTGYEFTDEFENLTGKKVYVPEIINYHNALKNTTIFTSTVMFDMQKLKKEQIYMPNVKSEDTACWWKILKQIDYAYGLNEILSYYRRSNGTLSSNKFEAIKRIWFLYRKVEKLSIIYSMYCFAFYALRAVIRRI